MKKRVIETKACPVCKVDSVVNKNAVHQAFHSKSYAKKRKALKKSRSKRAMQAGQALTVERLMTAAKLPDSFTPPQISWANLGDDDDNDKFMRNMLIAAGVVVALVTIYFDLGRNESTFLFMVVGGVIFFISLKAYNLPFARHAKAIKLFRHTWVCLRCRNEWTAKK